MPCVLAALVMILVAHNGASAQAIDTVSILRATAMQLRVERQVQDSASSARCRAGSKASCEPRYPRPIVWYLETHGFDGIRAGEILASFDSLEYVAHSAITPRCPWPADAPPRSGYRVRVSFDIVSNDSAEVGVHFKCGNPRGYLHAVYSLS